MFCCIVSSNFFFNFFNELLFCTVHFITSLTHKKNKFYIFSFPFFCTFLNLTRILTLMRHLIYIVEICLRCFLHCLLHCTQRSYIFNDFFYSSKLCNIVLSFFIAIFVHSLCSTLTAITLFALLLSFIHAFIHWIHCCPHHYYSSKFFYIL